MKQLIGHTDGTLHSVLYEPPNDDNNDLLFQNIRNPEKYFLVIDEASMIGPKLFEDLISWANKNVKILFVGDAFQLPAVLDKEEEVLHKNFSVFEDVSGPTLTEVMRNDGGIINQSIKLRSNCSISDLVSEGNFLIEKAYRPGSKAINSFLTKFDINDFNSGLITWTNKMRMQSNKVVRKRLGFNDPYIDMTELGLAFRNGIYYLNGEVIKIASIEFIANACGIDIFKLNNKEFISIQGRNEKCDGFLPFIEDYKNYKKTLRELQVYSLIPVSYGYCLTAHKAQGCEYDFVNIFLTGVDLRNKYMYKKTRVPGTEIEIPFINRWLYTAITRAKVFCNLFLGIN